MTRGSSNIDLTMIVEALKVIRVGKWADAAALALFIYDALLSLGDEYRYIWKAEWSTGKILYLATRYPINTTLSTLATYRNNAPSTAFSAVFCKRYEIVRLFGGVTQVILVQFILGLRTIALHGRDPRITAYVCTTGLFAIPALLTLCTVQVVGVVFDKYSFGASFSGCTADCISPSCRMMWKMVCLPILFFDAVMFFLTLRKHSQDAKHMKSPLLRVLYRDGFTYFAINFALVSTYFVIFNVARPSIILATYPLLRILLTIASTRLLLEIRRAYIRSLNNDAVLLSSGDASGLPPDMVTTTPTVGAWGIFHDFSHTYVKDPAHTRNGQVKLEVSGMLDPGEDVELSQGFA